MKLLTTLWTELTKPRGRRRPVIDARPSGVPPAAPATDVGRRRTRERGIALVVVLIAISIILVVTNQFGTSTVSDSLASANNRDQMRAHFLARSALNLSKLVMAIQKRLDNNKQTQGFQITDFADQLMLAFCGGEEEVRAAVGFSTSEVKGLGADIGTCGINGKIKTEDDKINLNCANGTDANFAALKSVLDGLVYFPAYDSVFEDPDAENWRRDRALQVSAILDYIDSNTLKNRDRGTTEDYGYESLKDPYYAKNNFLDTLGEMKLVRGVDDRFWSVFGSSFTVYGSCKVNLSALTNTQLIASILYLARKNENDPIANNPQKLFALAALVAKASQFGEQFSSPQDFVDFVKDPAGSVSSMIAGGGSAGSAASAATSAGALPSGGEKLGMELKLDALNSIARTGPRRIYRVEAWGEIPRAGVDSKGMAIHPPIRTTITGVWDTKVVNQNVRKPPVPNGAWVFLRED